MRDARFEWDDRKAKSNLRKHDVSFAMARLAFDDPRVVERLDLDEIDEDRLLLTGLAGELLLTVCFVDRPPRIRIISARKANQHETTEYNNQNT